MPAHDERMTFDAWTIVFGIAGLANLGNGLWMLAAPPHWYATLPAGVPDFGPLNEHFVRDIGCIFTLVGAGLIGAAVRRSWRIPALLVATGFSVLHAIVHVIDTARGLVGPEHWAIDAPGVYAPALLLSAITFYFLAKTE